jgi:hypothetical protein
MCLKTHDRAREHGGPSRYGGQGSCGDHGTKKTHEMRHMIRSLGKYTMYVLCGHATTSTRMLYLYVDRRHNTLTRLLCLRSKVNDLWTFVPEALDAAIVCNQKEFNPKNNMCHGHDKSTTGKGRRKTMDPPTITPTVSHSPVGKRTRSSSAPRVEGSAGTHKAYDLLKESDSD